MNVFTHFEARIASAIDALIKEGVLPPLARSRRFTVDTPRDPKAGDLVTNAALVLARPAGMKPHELAELLAAVLKQADDIEKIRVAGPGFINFVPTAGFWTDALRAITIAGADYGRAPAGTGGRITVAFAPFPLEDSLTWSQLRAAIFADALSNLLIFAGYEVIRASIPRLEEASSILNDLATLGVHQDFFFCEPFRKESANQISEAVAGGHDPAITENNHASFELTDEVSRFSLQLAQVHKSLSQGCEGMITVLGHPQRFRASAISAAINTMTEENKAINLKFCANLRLFRSGLPMTQAEFASGTGKAHGLINQTGLDIARFSILFRESDETLDFDLDNVVEQSWSNPVFYVQYAHARACSALRDLANAHSIPHVGEKIPYASCLRLLTDEAELSVIKRLSQFPRVIKSAAEGYAPQRIAFFLFELARDFHALWNRSKESPQLRFKVPGDCELTGARAALLAATARVMQKGLGLLGVKAVAEMR